MLFCLFETGIGNGGHKLHLLERYSYPVLFYSMIIFNDSCLTFLFFLFCMLILIVFFIPVLFNTL